MGGTGKSGNGPGHTVSLPVSCLLLTTPQERSLCSAGGYSVWLIQLMPPHNPGLTGRFLLVR